MSFRFAFASFVLTAFATPAFASDVSQLAGTFAYHSEGTYAGQPYGEIGLLSIDNTGRLSAQQWTSLVPDTPLTSTCELTASNVAGIINAACVNETLGNVPFDLTLVVDGFSSEIRFFGAGAPLLASGIAHRQLARNYKLSDLVGVYGYSSRGTLEGAPYVEAGYLSFTAEGTITAMQMNSAFGGTPLQSTCQLTLQSNGVGHATCTNSTLGGAAFTIALSVDVITNEIHFLGLSPTLIGVGTATRR